MLFLILLDGLNYEVFESLMKEGRLPNIRQYLLDELGGVWGEVLTTFPSATAPALPEMITGRYCYWHEHLPRKIHAFNRVKKEAYRYEFIEEAWENESDDLFEVVNRHRGQVLSSFKGSFKKTTTSYYSEFFYGLDAITDFNSLDVFNYDELVMMEIIRRLNKDPREYGMVFLYLTTTDLNGHFHGLDDPRYANSIIELDSLLGKLFANLKNLPGRHSPTCFEESHFIISGDHGMVSSGTYIDVARQFQNLQIPSLDLSGIFALLRNKLWSNWTEKLDVLVLPGGSSVAELYVRNYRQKEASSWSIVPAFSLLNSYPSRNDPALRHNLMHQLAAMQAIDLVMVQEDNDLYRIYSPLFGSARIYRAGRRGSHRFLYHVPASTIAWHGGDPLGYTQNPHSRDLVVTDEDLTAGNVNEARFKERFFSEQQWLSATYHTSRPLAVPYIAKAFSPHSTRSDLIITSQPGFNFMKLSKGDHGGLNRGAIMSGLLLAGPRVNPYGSLQQARLVDIYPTILALLDIEDAARHSRLDGTVLTSILR
ncbi:alkaline phosphatase family protein [bacterium]|nr:alkaline phosphatase family protein [candidate division CSSED10-310 bacterium]